jgi:hypothetical protein
MHTKFVGKPDRMSQLRRHKHRRKDNIKMDLKKSVGGCGLNLKRENSNMPSSFIKNWGFLD